MSVATCHDGLDGGKRSRLERLVIRARALLEDDLGAQLEGRFGIHVDGTIEAKEALPDDPHDRSTRHDLVEIVDHLLALGESSSSAVARLRREAAFTHLNRLLAIRIAEAINLLPESLGSGWQSRGFKQLGEMMPILSDDYWGYLLLCGDELAADAPILFDPRNPLLALVPSTTALHELVALLANQEAEPIWAAPDALGWAYQFFNTADERRLMREASSAPRNSRELAVRNQFFTPRYVVDFLVQNTLGRRLMENDPTSALVDDLALLVDPPTEPGSPLDLQDIAVLDPACGSGHFLLGCYDLLERAWELQGVPPSESAPAVVASLWGVDIDVRCAQVASAAVVLRARRQCRELPLPRPNIITARSLPGGSESLPANLTITAEQRHLVDQVGEALADAPLLGVLLKTDDALEQQIGHAAFGGIDETLPLADDAFRRVETDLMAHLQAIADRASSSVAERLLAAEADDALRLVDVARKRYDAVLMNPPFGEPVPETKAYLRVAYPWLPTKDSNLLAAFVGRGLELCKPDGYLGAITSRAGMFLITFEEWRRRIVLDSKLQALADLGLGVMEQALVEAAAYTIHPGQPPTSHETTFVRLLKDTNRQEGLEDAIRAHRAGLQDPRVYRVKLADLSAIPGAPLAYWMSPSLRRLFADLPMLEGHGAEVRQGLSTGADFRFVRAFWEVDPGHIRQSATDTQRGARWCPFAKGGEYSPYWADIHLVVDWGHDGEQLRTFEGSVIRNPQYYFRPGVTWPERTASGFGPRLLPAGNVFSHVGHGAFARGDTSELLGIMNSRLFATLLATFLGAGEETTSGSPAKRYSVGSVQRTPWLGHDLNAEQRSQIRISSASLCQRQASLDTFDETTRLFISPIPANEGVQAAAEAMTDTREVAALAALDEAARIERAIHEGCGLSEDAITLINDEWGMHPTDFPQAPLDSHDEQLFESLYTTPTDALIDRLALEFGASKAIVLQNYVADRRLEILAHAFLRHPRTLHTLRGKLGLLPPEEPKKTAEDLFSYLVGASFGRWDVRIGRDRSIAPPAGNMLEAMPVCPPGMLTGPDGFPAVHAPPGYRLAIPPNGLLVDEAGHEWDIEKAISLAADALFNNASDIISDMLRRLRSGNIRDHLRKRFFKAHLSRYSKSRRKAPIYWPLTVPSMQWGIWVYAPTLKRETLYAISSEAARRERLAGEAIARMQSEQRAESAARQPRAIAEDLDFEEKLAEELRLFRAEAERIAALGWQPDLDDGIVLCAAPIADLFPAWPGAKKAREELRDGRYDWATVSRLAAEL